MFIRVEEYMIKSGSVKYPSKLHQSEIMRKKNALPPFKLFFSSP
jgi:hypothetical protein